MMTFFNWIKKNQLWLAIALLTGVLVKQQMQIDKLATAFTQETGQMPFAGYDPRSTQVIDKIWDDIGGDVAQIYVAPDSLKTLVETSVTDGGIAINPDNLAVTTQVHTTGTSLTVTANVVYVNPSTALSSLTITLPASPTDQQEVEFHFGGTISPTFPVVTTLTLPASVYAGSLITSASGADSFTLRYDSASAKWYF